MLKLKYCRFSSHVSGLRGNPELMWPVIPVIQRCDLWLETAQCPRRKISRKWTEPDVRSIIARGCEVLWQQGVINRCFEDQECDATSISKYVKQSCLDHSLDSYPPPISNTIHAVQIYAAVVPRTIGLEPWKIYVYKFLVFWRTNNNKQIPAFVSNDPRTVGVRNLMSKVKGIEVNKKQPAETNLILFRIYSMWA